MTGLRSARSTTLLAAAAGLVSGAALIIAGVSDLPAGRRCDEARDTAGRCETRTPRPRRMPPETAAPHRDPAPTPPKPVARRGDDPFAALPSQHLVAVTARHDGVIDERTGMVFEAELARLDPDCTEEYCDGGCYEFVAIALDETLEDIEVRVSTPDEPDDWFGMTIDPGPSVSASFCVDFAQRKDPTFPVRVETLASVGHGRVAVQGWLEPLSDNVEANPPDVPPPTTGTPLPDSEFKPTEPATVRFMGSGPHVPLARVFLNEIKPPPPNACVRWPAHRHHWLALDRWGQIAGKHRSLGGEAYDVTECYEMSLEALDGDMGVGLLASVGYRAAPSFEATPTPDQRRDFDALRTHLDAMWPSPDAPRPEPMFFHGADDVLTAVVGGRTLAVAAFVDGEWAVRHLETEYAPEPTLINPYRPIAVFDLSGDGNPEIVFRQSEGVSWNDVVLSGHGTWYRAAESIGGGTI